MTVWKNVIALYMNKYHQEKILGELQCIKKGVPDDESGVTQTLASAGILSLKMLITYRSG